ncbi:glycosyltransferase family 39 protein [Bartonella sp. LJL80]
MTENQSRYGNAAICFILLYFAFEAVFVTYISGGAGLDDAELISNISFWNWGYGGSQPPLYTWFAYGLTQIFGVHLALYQFLKFSVLASTFLAVYAGLRCLNVKPTVAAAAMLAMFLLPQIGWESQRALTHSIMGTAGSAWTFAAFALFSRRQTWLRAILLGLACAAAILGKYNGGLFLLALVGGALLTAPIRPCLATRTFPVALLTAVAAMFPALFFMLMHPAGVTERANKLAVGKSGHFLFDRVSGLTDFAMAALSFCSLALLVILLFFGARALAKKNTLENAMQQDDLAVRFLSRILLFGICLIALLVVVLGITNVKDRWLQPLLFLAPAYFTLALARLPWSQKYVRAYGVVGACAGLIVPFALYINIATTFNRADPPEQLLDYASLENALRQQGPFEMILSRRPQLPGNLRLRDPSLKTLHADTPMASERLQKPLMVMWTGDEKLPDDLSRILSAAGFDTDGQIAHFDIGFKGDTDAKRRIYTLYLP